MDGIRVNGCVWKTADIESAKRLNLLADAMFARAAMFGESLQPRQERTYQVNASAIKAVVFALQRPAGLSDCEIDDLKDKAQCLVLECGTLTDGCCTPDVLVTPLNINGPLVKIMAAFEGCAKESAPFNSIVSGGTEPYQYLWSNGAKTQNTTLVLGETPINDISLTVTDAHKFRASDSLIFSTCTPMELSLNSCNVSCAGKQDGSASAAVSGGKAPYRYIWSNDSQMPAISGLAPGSYSVTVIDTTGESVSACATITSPDPLVVGISFKPISCNCKDDGEATANVAGGSSPYKLIWAGGQSAQTLTGLGPGTYSVTVVDANGCLATDAQFLTEPSPLTAQIINDSVACAGENSGKIEVAAKGGTPCYKFALTAASGAPVPSTNTNAQGNVTQYNNLVSAPYYVTVTDSHGCIYETGPVFVAQNPPLSIEMKGKNPTCPGQTTGRASAKVQGGQGPYTYAWSKGDCPLDETTSEVCNTTAGEYTVTAVDSAGCSITGAILLQNENNVDIRLVNQTSTSIEIEPVDMATGYQFIWTGPGGYTSSSQNLTGLLEVGIYELTVIDANGCQVHKQFRVMDDTPLKVTYEVSNCNPGNNTACITVFPTGGDSPTYTYAWTGPACPCAATANICSLTPGDYTVVVTETLSGLTQTLTITVPSDLSFSPTSEYYCDTQSACQTFFDSYSTPILQSDPLTGFYQGAAGTSIAILNDSNGCCSVYNTEITATVLTNDGPKILTVNLNQLQDAVLTPSGGTMVLDLTPDGKRFDFIILSGVEQYYVQNVNIKTACKDASGAIRGNVGSFVLGPFTLTT